MIGGRPIPTSMLSQEERSADNLLPGWWSADVLRRFRLHVERKRVYLSAVPYYKYYCTRKRVVAVRTYRLLGATTIVGLW